MHISAHLDVDVVALEADDTLTVMLDLTAPASGENTQRPVNAAIVVLDRSASMSGNRLASAKRALLDLVARLDERDSFGLVVFDTQANVIVPAGTIKELGRERIRAGIESVTASGTTDLSSGYLRGLQEARRVAGPAGATIIVLSDGHANAGILEPDRFRDLAANAASDGITTSSIGIGTGYDDLILSEVAIGGAGNHTFAQDADSAAAAVAAEIDGLLSKTVQAASLAVAPSQEVSTIAVLNDLPTHVVADCLIVELGDFYSGEQRRLLFKVGVPALADLGLTQVADFTFTFVAIPDLTTHTITVPISVNVVPEDVARGRVPDPKVVQEKLIQETQQAKRASETALRQGDVTSARTELETAISSLRSSLTLSDNADVADELGFLQSSLHDLEGVDEAASIRSDIASYKMSASRAKRARGYTSRTQGGHTSTDSTQESGNHENRGPNAG